MGEMILNHVFSWSKSALGDDTAVKLLSDIRDDLNELSAPCDITDVLKNFYEKIKPDEEPQSTATDTIQKFVAKNGESAIGLEPKPITSAPLAQRIQEQIQGCAKQMCIPNSSSNTTNRAT